MGAIRNLVDALRREGLTVHEWAGWDGRGNEGIGQIEPHGAVIHHTATPYGGAFNGLVSSTRPGMIGAVLCNFSGNSDGSLTVIASGLAWHAGQGAGPSLGALAPWRSWLNRYSVGLEIVYPGDQPMTSAQYRTAVRFSRVVADMFGGGNVECIRAHAETNGAPGDGKWDPGYAPGKTIDMNQFRRDVLGAPGGEQEDDMFTDDDRRRLNDLYAWNVSGGTTADQAVAGGKLPPGVSPRSIFGLTLDTNRALASLFQATGKNIGEVLADLYRRDPAVVDVDALAAALLPSLSSAVTRLGDADLSRIAEAVADELDRRARDNDPTTGPTS